MPPMKKGLDISVLRPPRSGSEPARERHERSEPDQPQNELRHPIRVDRGYPDRPRSRFRFPSFWIGAASIASGLLFWWLLDRKKKAS